MPYSWAKSKQQPAIDDKQKGRSSLGDPAKSIISIHPPSLPHVAILRKRRRKRYPDERGWIREREKKTVDAAGPGVEYWNTQREKKVTH
jgi:hypothetical protein